MHSPVLITPPAALPVTLDEAKLHLRVDGAYDDIFITGLLQAAVSHLDGWTGILGRALVEQTWRMDFDAFERCIRLPLEPVTNIVSITWRNAEGEISTIGQSHYALRSDALGPYVHWDKGYSFPSDLYESAAVAVTFVAGYPEASVPPAIKLAIMLMVGHWHSNRDDVVTGTIATQLPMGARALLAPWSKLAL